MPPQRGVNIRICIPLDSVRSRRHRVGFFLHGGEGQVRGRNIYCRNSRLSSLCTRMLIERYVAGDTATQARRVLVGDSKRPPVFEPTRCEAAQHVDRFLAIYPTSHAQVRRFADHCRQARPEHWRPVSISRQAVNAHFLKLGRVCWERVAEPHLRAQAQRSVRVFDELNRELGLIDETLTDLLVERIAQRYVKEANGTLLANPDIHLRYGKTIDYLRERAAAYQGLSVRHSREHMAWAFLVNSVHRQLGVDDRSYGARFLTGLLMRAPM